MYIPMTMTPEEAREELARGKIDAGVATEVEQLLSREKLTPLQAQAVLTRAWDWVITQGKIADRTQ